MNSSKPKQGFFSNLRYDLPASIVVFLVAMPLCLGIALASGAPLFSGIIAGIVGGTVVALLSGSPLGVSGPAAGLAVIVLSSIQELGAFDIFLLAVVIAGVIQLILGFMKAGVIGYYFPSSVIKGMLAGIGIIIIIKQIPHAVGYIQGTGNYASLLGNPASFISFITPGVLLIAVISMGVLILWEQPFMKKIPLFKIIQGPLVVVVVGILLNLLFINTQTFLLQPNQMVTIPVPGSVGDFFGQFTFPDFSQWMNPQVYVIALTIAVVASLETLLCVEATDKLDPQKRVTPTNRELTAQGVGNIFSGLIGGLPITQVIVRSSANIQSGGRTKTSAFIHGVFLLISAMAIPKLLNLIPLASLAAILFVVGYKLAKPVLFVEMYRKGKEHFIPFIITIFGIVFTDLLTGIGLGLVIAIFYILWNNYKIPYHFDPNDYVKDQPLRLVLAEDVSFMNKASILRTLKHLPDGMHMIIDGSKTKSIHPDVLEIIDDFKESAKTRGITVDTIGLTAKEVHDPVKQLGQVVLQQPWPKKSRLSTILSN
jgi:MFS superfamily sulfate permease-like transporter